MKHQADFSSFSELDTRARIVERVVDFEEDLVGETVNRIVNFPDKQIASFRSELLKLGALGKEGR